MIDAKGIHTTPDKLQAIIDAPATMSFSSIELLQKVHSSICPLNTLLCKNAKCNWTPERQGLANAALSSSSLFATYPPCW